MAKTILPLLCLLGVVGSIALAQTERTDAQVEKAILELDRRWIDAFFRGDGTTMNELEAPDFALLDADGSLNFKDKPRPAKSPKPIARTRVVEKAKVRVAGDVAILTGIEVIKLTGDEAKAWGPEIRDSITSVCRRINGEWRMWSYHSTRVNPDLYRIKK